MKNFNTLLLLLFCSIGTFSQVKNLTEESTFFDFLELYSSQNGDSIPSKHIQRLAKIWGPRLAPSGDCSVASEAYYEYAQNYSSYQSNTYDSNWEELGPIGTNTNAINGQIHNIIFDPYYNITNQTVYACSSFGGLWRSENDGFNWYNVNTDIGIPSCAVSDLAIHPSDSNKLFLSTGSADGGIARYQTRASHVNPIYSVGVYRSVDYGSTWEPINSGLDSMLNDGFSIREIEINPQNPNQIFIATDNGVYRTNNANAANPSWTLVLTGPAGVDDTEFKELEFKPYDLNTVYVSGQDIYKSNDGGTTWNSMTVIYNGLDLTNLPDNFNVDRINITVTTNPSASERLYTYIIGTEEYNTSGDTRRRLYIYMFNGIEWVLLNTKYNKENTPCNYYNVITPSRIAIAVSPVNPDAVYYGTTGVFGCNDITTPDFIDLSCYVTNDPFHCDVHALEFPPNISNEPLLFCGNDGGVSVKSYPFNDTDNWEARSQGLGVSTLWSFDDSENNEGYILSGFQDNGVQRLHNNSWLRIFGGDGYGAQINDNNNKNAFILSNRSLWRYNYATGEKDIECNNTASANVQYYDYRPWDPVGTNLRSILIADFEIKNEPKSGDMYWTYSEINKRIKDIPGTDDDDNPNNIWELKSNIYDFFFRTMA